MWRLFSTRSLFVAAAILVAGALACTGSTDNPAGPSSSLGAGIGVGGTSQPVEDGKARLTMAITDSPFSASDAVIVEFDRVSVHRAESGWEELDLINSPRLCDLKKLDGPSDILGIAELPPGHYTEIRLDVVDATIYFASGPSGGGLCDAIAPTQGDAYPVTIASGEIKLNRQFTLEAGDDMTLLLDFDGDKSIREIGAGNGSSNGGGNANGSGNANGNGGGNGNGNGGGGSDAKTRRFMMSPVIGIVDNEQ